jgi:hypothetical protein
MAGFSSVLFVLDLFYSDRKTPGKMDSDRPRSWTAPLLYFVVANEQHLTPA